MRCCLRCAVPAVVGILALLGLSASATELLVAAEVGNRTVMCRRNVRARAASRPAPRVRCRWRLRRCPPRQPRCLGTSPLSDEQLALHRAITQRQIDVMEALLKRGVEYRVRDERGRTAMGLAVASGSEALATRFLLSIPDVDLAEAAGRGDADAVLLVLLGDPERLKLKPPVNYYHVLPPLVAAAEKRQVKISRIRQLLNPGLLLPRKKLDRKNWLIFD